MNEIIELNLLREVANNPRVSTTEQVEIYKNILQRFGNIIPVIIDENNYVISDYAKVKAAIKLGMKEINCIRINNLSENEIQTIRIAETRAIELGKWDYQKLFDELSKIGEDFKLTGFDLDEIKKYCNEENYKIVYNKLKEFEKEGYIKIENNFAIYQLKGIFWGNSLVADIIEEIGRYL